MKKKAKTGGIVGLIIKICLWAIALPIMLAIFLYKKGILSKKTAIIVGVVGTIFWGLIASSGGTNNSNAAGAEKSTINYTEISEDEIKSAANQKVKSLTFSNTELIEVRVGQSFSKPYTHYIKVSMAFGSKLSPAAVRLISENPEIATISITDVSSSNIKYSIKGVSAGETFIYATSADGSVVSGKIRVIVPKPIEAESISVEYSKTDLAIGEIIKPKIEILPSNTEDKTISWTSSDINVVSVDSGGVVKGIRDGTSTITATTSNGLSQSIDFAVDGSKHLMNLKTTQNRTDSNNIGDEWSYQIEINGEPTYKTIAISAGEKLKFRAKFTEADKNPDVGEASTSYVVKEEDLENGFEVSMNLSVRENGGKNSGKTADFVITFTFSPYDK